MAGKGQEVKIVVHIPEDMCSILNSENVEAFWEEVIEKRLREYQLSEKLKNQIWTKAAEKIVEKQ